MSLLQGQYSYTHKFLKIGLANFSSDVVFIDFMALQNLIKCFTSKFLIKLYFIIIP